MKSNILIEEMRNKKPVVHHITNYVTVNDCANITLAIGASPIMADAVEEVADITKISSSLVINIGTLNKKTVSSMIEAGKVANKYKIPVIFDPVGVGASKLRSETAIEILKKVKVDVLRGNISEMQFLAGIKSEIKGVDASNRDIKSANIEDIAKKLVSRYDCVVAITGETDIISDGNKTIFIENGHEMLTSLTGTGCMCSSLIGSFCGAFPDNLLYSTTNALLCMAIAGEIAYEEACGQGNGSFYTKLHDAISLMNEQTIEQRMRYYEA